MTTDRYLRRVTLLAATLALLAGCAAGVKKDNTADVETRAVARWNYLIAHQAEKAYDYLSPGYRATAERGAYAKAMNGRPVQWKKVVFNKKKCDADRCTVYLVVSYSANISAGLGRPIESVSPLAETWVRVKGKWYYLPSS
ncbi:MAG: hypothetical protein WB784_07095 [Rhodanobacteraceae bacterium]